MTCYKNNCNNPRKIGNTLRGYNYCDKHFKEYSKNYYKNNRKQILYTSKKCRLKMSATKKQAIQFSHRYGTKILDTDLESILCKQLRNCAICKEELTPGWHIDHIVPVALGGCSNISNLQILCPMCNLGKYKFSQNQYIEHCKKVANIYSDVKTIEGI